MEMIYQNNTLFVDLSGEIDIEKFKKKLFYIIDTYKITKVIINATDVFNYKRKDFSVLKEEFKGKLNIVRWRSITKIIFNKKRLVVLT